MFLVYPNKIGSDVGFVGLNNLKANDYMNVAIQLLTHVPPLRNFFMLENLDARPELGISPFSNEPNQQSNNSVWLPVKYGIRKLSRDTFLPTNFSNKSMQPPKTNFA